MVCSANRKAAAAISEGRYLMNEYSCSVSSQRYSHNFSVVWSHSPTFAAFKNLFRNTYEKPNRWTLL